MYLLVSCTFGYFIGNICLKTSMIKTYFSIFFSPNTHYWTPDLYMLQCFGNPTVFQWLVPGYYTLNPFRAHWHFRYLLNHPWSIGPFQNPLRILCRADDCILNFRNPLTVSRVSSHFSPEPLYFYGINNLMKQKLVWRRTNIQFGKSLNK